MGKFALGLLSQLVSLFSGALGGAWEMLTGMVSKAYGAFEQYNQKGISFARQVGMNAKEAQAYTEVLVSRAEKLGRAYGISAEQVYALQENLAAATGKAMMLNEQEAERMVQINKMVGSNVANEFTSEIMSHMGGQLSTVQGAVSKAYATGAKSGLNAVKFSEKVAKNLSLANKLSFRDGVNGIIKMTALSEKLGFNLQSVEQAASNFMDIDKAIENAAQLQMLGGAAGAYGGNPLEMAYEANYDPEAFTERMTKMLGGYATFDKESGMANVGGTNRMFVAEIAKKLGIGMEEAMSIAKKQAEVKYKEGAFGAKFGSMSKEDQDFIMNKSYIENGRLMINDASGGKHDITNGNVSPEILEELKKFDNMSELDVMKSQAQSLTSIQEEVAGIKTSFYATLAKPMIEHAKTIQGSIKQVGAFLIDNIAKPASKFIGKALSWYEENKQILTDTLSIIGGVIGGTLSFFRNNWSWLKWALLTIIASIGIGKLAKFGVNTYKRGARIARTVKGWFGRGGGGGAAAATNVGKTGFFNRIGGFLANARTSIGNKLKGLGDVFAKARTTIGSKLSGIGDFFVKAKATIGSKLSGIGDFFVKAKATIGSKLNSLGDVFAKARTSIGNKLKGLGDAFNNFRANVGSMASTARANVSNTAGTFWGKTKNATKNGWNTAKRFFKTPAAKVGGIGALLTVVDGIGAISDYSNNKDELDNQLNSGQLTREEYDTQVRGAQDERNERIGGAAGSAIGAAIGTAVAGPIGTFIGGWVGDFLGSKVGKYWNTATEYASKAWDGIKGIASNVWDGIKGIAKDSWEGIKTFGKTAWEGAKGIISNSWIGDSWRGIKKFWNGVFAEGGVVGGNSYEGDRVLARVNSGEMILNKNQQTELFDILNKAKPFNSISSLFKPTNDVKAKPVGGKEYVYSSKEDKRNGVTELTVKDININVSGTIKLDAGTMSKDIDINRLLSDTSFVSSLKEMIKSSINNDMNGGRFMNDNATLRGSVAPTTYWGR